MRGRAPKHLQLLQRRIRLGRQQGANASLVVSQRKRLLPGSTLPVRRQHCTSLIAQLSLTENCSAAPRRELPASTARTIRSRRSNEYGFAIQAGLLNPATSLNHKFAPKGIPLDSFRTGNALITLRRLRGGW
jgi:hypothetical protein